MGTEAETGRLGEALNRLIPHIEQVWRWEDPDTVIADQPLWRDGLGGPIPEVGVGLDQVLDELNRLVIPYGNRLGQPGFHGWIENGPTTVGVAAQLAATTTSPHRYLVSACSHLEHVALTWLQSLLGVPAGHQGLFSPGGSVANLVGLGAARQAAYEARGVDASLDGIDGPGAIYASSEAHHTIQRSAAVLGLGRNSVRPIPVDEHHRMVVDEVARAIGADRAAGVTPVAIVGTAGTTNAGAIDPLDRLADLAADQRVWFHVDGAYGLLAACLPELAPSFEGMGRADSMIVDPHKWLSSPIGIGATFVRDADLLKRAFTEGEADYLEGSFRDGEPESIYDTMAGDWADYGVELTAPSRGVVVWAMLREQGVEGVRALVRRDLGFARRLADRVRAEPRLELVTEPELSIVCFRYVPEGATDGPEVDDLNAEILRRLHRETDFVPSSTVLAGRYALRPCYVNPRTTEATVDGLADAVLAIGARLTAET